MTSLVHEKAVTGKREGCMTKPQVLLAELEEYLVEKYEVELWQAEHAVAAWLRKEPEIPSTEAERERVAEHIYTWTEYWPDA
jgi:hypothetical protein